MKAPIKNESQPAHVMHLPQSSACLPPGLGLVHLQGAGAQQEMEFALSPQQFFTGSGLWKIGIFYQACILK